MNIPSANKFSNNLTLNLLRLLTFLRERERERKRRTIDDGKKAVSEPPGR